MNVVTRVLKCIRSSAINHGQFVYLLNDIESDHVDMPYHSNLRWLSLAYVFNRVCELEEERIIFLEMKQKMNDLPELKQTTWLNDFYFLIHIINFLNELNFKLQGKRLH